MIKITTSINNLDYTTDIELEGQEFKYRLYWHELYDRWYLDLLDSTGIPLIQGKKITLGVPLTRYRKLQGDFFVVSRDQNTSPPGIVELGDRVNIYYLSSTELDKATKIRTSYELADFFNTL